MGIVYIGDRFITATTADELTREEATYILESITKSIEHGIYVLEPTFKEFVESDEVREKMEYENDLTTAIPATMRKAIKALNATAPLPKERNNDVLDKKGNPASEYRCETRYYPCLYVITSLLAGILTLLFIISAKLG